MSSSRWKRVCWTRGLYHVILFTYEKACLFHHIFDSQITLTSQAKEPILQEAYALNINYKVLRKLFAPCMWLLWRILNVSCPLFAQSSQSIQIKSNHNHSLEFRRRAPCCELDFLRYFFCLLMLAIRTHQNKIMITKDNYCNNGHYGEIS